jgi:hypothetical protein
MTILPNSGDCSKEGLIALRGCLAAISAEGPTYAKGGIKPVRAVGVKVVLSAQGLAVTPEPIHLMLRGAQFEMFRQLKSDANGPLKRDWQHGCRVSMLRDIPSKTELGSEEQKEMPRRRAAERLKFDVSAKQIARVSGAGGSRPGRRGKHTPAEIRFVMRRGHFEIRVTANPVGREEGSRRGRGRRHGIRFENLGLRMRRYNTNGQQNAQDESDFLQWISPRFRHVASRD